jgi:murein DD-endopeptidase MepM/ murein hydrolase activator NlpD
MRILGRFFKERQIYHRSDGVVRFIKLTMRTQLALALAVGVFLLWVAYSSVNFVFKEQIILAKDREIQNKTASYRRLLSEQEQAYDDVSSLNVIYAREFDAAMSQMEARVDTLTSIVQNRTRLDNEYEALARKLSEVGGPNGQKMTNGNRIMVDSVGREPTPRQSREARIMEEALNEVMSSELTAGIDNEVLQTMREKTARASAKQVMLMAMVEEDVKHRIREISQLIDYTGIDSDLLIAKSRIKTAGELASISEFANQGGPTLNPDNPSGKPSVYFQSASRIAASMEEYNTLNNTLSSIPLSTPIIQSHGFTSGFGMRWDPVNRSKRGMHEGIDLVAAWRAPIKATAQGKVKFAGVRGGYGKTVEIDHGNGFITRYAHMSRIKVRTGQKVNIHDTVGLLGNSGKSTGPHLHYEVHYKGRKIDPMRFIRAGRYVFES